MLDRGPIDRRNDARSTRMGPMRRSYHCRDGRSGARASWPAIAAAVCLAVATPRSSNGQHSPDTSNLTSNLRSAPTAPPTLLSSRIFFIPYQPPSEPLGAAIESVELCVSRDRGSTWQPLQRAEPQVRGFTYHAPADGRYDFAVRVRRQGDSSAAGYDQLTPQLQVKVDSAQPTLRLSAAPDSTGGVVVQYDARDASLIASPSVRLEAQADEGPWDEISLREDHGVEHGWLYGSGRWRPPKDSRLVRLRMSVADEAGNVATAAAQTTMAGPAPPGPRLEGGPDNSPDAIVNRQPRAEEVATHGWASRPVDRAPIEWPAPARGRAASQDPTIVGPIAQGLAIRQDRPLGSESRADLPPSDNSYTARDRDVQRSAPTRFAAGSRPVHLGDNDGAHGPPDEPEDSSPLSAPPLMTTASAQVGAAASLENSNRASRPLANRSAEWDGIRLVNSRTFDFQYDVDATGPWGVAKIEIWGTTDGGRTWTSYGVDADHRSPIRVVTPSSGTYGFRIVVDGANRPPSPPPSHGDQPELLVTVDLTAPSVRLISAGCVDSQGASELHIHWFAEDAALEPQPIGLFYSSFPQGPWNAIATGIANTGQYAWRLERHLPDQFYLRIEAHDRAGNVAAYQTATAVVLDRPQPTGRLRDVRRVDP